MSHQHRVLVVGVGSIGERHVRCFQQTGRADLALCEINDALRRQVADRYGISRAYRDVASALVDEQYDAAVVCTPADRHLPIALRLVQAGIDLLIEKPLSTTLVGVAELEQAVARQNRVVGVAYVQRANPVLAALKEALDGGRFGRPLQLTAVCGQDFPSYRPAYREIYYADRATGGGAIQDALTHVLNAGQWLLGPVDRLVADASHQHLEGVQVEDTVHLLARHGSVLASYALNQYQAPNELTITVVCQRGTVRLELHRHRWRWMTDPDTSWHDQPLEPLPRDGLFVRQADHFLDAVERTATPLCTLAEGLHTLRVNLAALESVEQRQWQTVARGEM